MTLQGKTLFITGASRGIGLAIALRAAKDGANIAIAAKTAEPHPKLPGTIYSAAKQIEEAGGKALPIICDIRFEDQIIKAIEKTVQTFGGIDILVNNASAIDVSRTSEIETKKYDLINQINSRGTWLVSKYAIPHLKKGRNPHILNISPPLDMNGIWFKDHTAYSISKYNMSMVVLGLAGELKKDRIAVNALWPLTTIKTAAVKGQEQYCRKPEIMADSAYLLFTKYDYNYSGNFLIDEIFLRKSGIRDLDCYSVIPGSIYFIDDFFITDAIKDKVESLRKGLPSNKQANL